jgi:Ca2+-dependent lipid-binding protein
MEFSLDDKLKILIEISSGRDLMVGDITSSDPYVIVMLGKEQVHKTNHIPKTYVMFDDVGFLVLLL